ncbi:MAG: glycosyltransferase [Candidatus Azobacteroides sp.]|nr:glycosyltransferase [Candidatus Azobacteroides sp.]
MSFFKKRVIVSVTNDLVTDQRVHKVCTTLSQNGYTILLVGRKMKESLPVYRDYRTKRFKLFYRKGPLFYAEYNLRLFLFLLFAKADIFLANDTDVLCANYMAAKIKRKKLVFDAHEMFPEVPEVVSRPVIKWIWTKVEDLIFPHLKYCYTVCQPIADEYNEKYGIFMQVVRNAPFSNLPVSENKNVFSTDKKVILYQGAVNLGRGIEWIIDAMPYIDNAVFYIIGEGDKSEELKERVKHKNLEDKVIFLGRIPFNELSVYTKSSDLGVCLLEKLGKNYYYSLPNRIFDFIHADVPLLATDFPEIRKVITNYKVGELVSDYRPAELAKAIQRTLEKWDKKEREEITATFEKAKKELCWENESITLLKIFSY